MLLIKNGRLLTLAGGARLRRGGEMRELGILPRGDVLVAEGRIAAVGPKLEAPAQAQVLDASGRIVMPGFVDCHTHACFAGSGVEAWENRAAGGTASVMLAVQEATLKQLAAALRQRLVRMLREGTTTAEVKSGYGMNTAGELKMLRAIVRAGQEWAGTVVPTALIGHPVQGRTEDEERTAARETLHEVSQEFPGIAVDALVDEGEWSRETAVRLFEKAAKHHPLRVHADAVKSLGMIPEAIRLHARSVDHLEAATKEDLVLLGSAAQTGAVILPSAGFHQGGRYARAGFLVDQGGAVALGTDYNPISAPIHSMPLAIALAVRRCGLTPAEAIVAATVNAAAVLGLKDRGTLEAGQRADLIVLCHSDERMLAYECGGNPVDAVVCGGEILSAG